MKFPPFALAGVACTAALVLSQALIPTVKAQSVSIPNYRVLVKWQKTSRGPSGLLMRGKVINTGSKPLIYTQVLPTLRDGAGKIVYTGCGYLTVSPLEPGQSAEFRACEAEPPAFNRLQVTLREAGQPVMVEEEAPK